MAVPVQFTPELQFGLPRILFEYKKWMSGLPSPTPYGNDYAVSPDGERFLLNAVDEAAPQSPITVIVNWMADLKK